jgi:hypothetical protein
MRHALFTAALVALSACVITDDSGNDSTITVDNESSFVLDEVHVAPVDSQSWGPNLVPEALFPGESVDISVSCDFYDVLVVDETGVDCVLSDLDLCFSSGVWVVTDGTLDNCAFN